MKELNLIEFHQLIMNEDFIDFHKLYKREDQLEILLHEELSLFLKKQPKNSNPFKVMSKWIETCESFCFEDNFWSPLPSTLLYPPHQLDKIQVRNLIHPHIDQFKVVFVCFCEQDFPYSYECCLMSLYWATTSSQNKIYFCFSEKKDEENQKNPKKSTFLKILKHVPHQLVEISNNEDSDYSSEENEYNKTENKNIDKEEEENMKIEKNEIDNHLISTIKNSDNSSSSSNTNHSVATLKANSVQQNEIDQSTIKNQTNNTIDLTSSSDTSPCKSSDVVLVQNKTKQNKTTEIKQKKKKKKKRKKKKKKLY